MTKFSKPIQSFRPLVATPPDKWKSIEVTDNVGMAKTKEKQPMSDSRGILAPDKMGQKKLCDYCPQTAYPKGLVAHERGHIRRKDKRLRYNNHTALPNTPTVKSVPKAVPVAPPQPFDLVDRAEPTGLVDPLPQTISAEALQRIHIDVLFANCTHCAGIIIVSLKTQTHRHVASLSDLITYLREVEPNKVPANGAMPNPFVNSAGGEDTPANGGYEE